MSRESKATRLSRRAFLTNAVSGLTGIALLVGETSAQTQTPPKPPAALKESYAPFQMGLQSYSLRAFQVEDALKKTQALGLKFWEAYPGHLPLSDDPRVLTSYKELLKTYDIRLLAYGVVDFRNDEKDARSKFNFARAMGIKTLSAYPQPDSFPLLDRLVAEYKIRIAIHNHGPGDDLYDKMDKEWKAISGHHELIGACEDTGHRLRSDESPVVAVTKFGKRVYGVHLKDVKDGPNGEKLFTEIGKGKLDTIELLKVLKANRFDGVLALEYEEHEKDPIPYIEDCLSVTRFAIRRVNELRK